MKRFLAVYMGGTERALETSGWNAMDAEERKARVDAGIRAWMAWGAQHARAITDQGSPLGKTKRTGADGVTDIKNDITGYAIVEAESHEAAARMFESHPHFTIFPGESVEIMECLSIPDIEASA